MKNKEDKKNPEHLKIELFQKFKNIYKRKEKENMEEILEQIMIMFQKQ
jgi:hypothetical protein